MEDEQDPKKLRPGALVRGDRGEILVRNHKGELVPLPIPHTAGGHRVTQEPRKEK